ncbi:hypothetical protein O0L34_g3141 [Tuta absoluta]|nr:hypothetical protein O0L34_g3141 [Tuta absoluta]
MKSIKVPVPDQKRTPLVLCAKCNARVRENRTFQCLICKKYYEFTCAGYSDKLYNLLTHEQKVEKKKNWKCKSCDAPKRKSNPPITTKGKKKVVIQTVQNKVTSTLKPSPPSIEVPYSIIDSLNPNSDTHPRIYENIPTSPEFIRTLVASVSHATEEPPLPGQPSTSSGRYSQTTTDQQNEDYAYSTTLPESSSTSNVDDTLNELYGSNDMLSRSLDLKTNHVGDIEDLKELVTELTSCLESTENQLEETILENNKLKRVISKLTQDITFLKGIYLTRASPKMCKRRSMNSTPIRSIATPTRQKVADTYNVFKLESQIARLQTELSRARLEIEHLNQQIRKNKLNYPRHKTKHSSSTQDEKLARNDCEKPKIHIFGAQSTKGLAMALVNSRCCTKYKAYEISATIKANAMTKDIISDTPTEVRPNDKVVISIGENDSSPRKTLELLKKTLHSLTECSVIILPVQNVNPHINSHKLNFQIENLCNQFINCRFLTLDQSFPGIYLKKICKKLNTLIDSIDHDRNYLHHEQNPLTPSSDLDSPRSLYNTENSASQIPNSTNAETANKESDSEFFRA